jgi:hypothetical protein
LQEEILESLEDVGSEPLGRRRKVLRRGNDEKNKEKGDALSYQSTAILVKQAVFIVFVISDEMSMMLSIFVVFIHFLISLIQGSEMVKDEDRDQETTRILFGVATLFTMIGMRIMIIAFITGTYTILEPSLGLAITVCLIGLSL